jgi:hypothetical protein
MKSIVGYFFVAMIGFLFLLTLFFFHKTISSWYTKQKNIKDYVELTALTLTLAMAFLSIYNSDITIKEARNFFNIQTRPYITIENVAIKVYDDVKLRNGVDKYCKYFIKLKNNGNIPASDVSSMENISFKNKDGDIVKLSTHPTSKDDIPISRMTGSFIIGTGEISRQMEGDLWINKEDADPIRDGNKAVNFDISIFYSAPRYNMRWNYKINAELIGKNLEIKHEEETSL